MGKMKLLIEGGRFFNHKFLFQEALYKQLEKWGIQYIPNDIDCVICGMATGADTLGFRWAMQCGISIHSRKRILKLAKKINSENYGKTT